MGRKPMWKYIPITNSHHNRVLESYWNSNLGAWKKYEAFFARGGIETNLPYAELRRWFRYAIDESVPPHVTDVVGPVEIGE